MATRRRIFGSSIRYRLNCVGRAETLGVVFFLVDAVRFVVFFGAGFVALATFAVDFFAEAAVVFTGVARDADASFLVPVTLDRLAPRTSRIAVECSCIVILNSWWPSRLATK